MRPEEGFITLCGTDRGLPGSEEQGGERRGGGKQKRLSLGRVRDTPGVGGDPGHSGTVVFSLEVYFSIHIW